MCAVENSDECLLFEVRANMAASAVVIQRARELCQRSGELVAEAGRYGVVVRTRAGVAPEKILSKNLPG